MSADKTAEFIQSFPELAIKLNPTTDHEAAPSELFHYTKAPAFMAIVENRTLWATHFRHLNDSGEHTRGIELARHVLLNLAPSEHLLDPKLVKLAMDAGKRVQLGEGVGPYVLSFSTEGNLLSQWRGYADNGAGYSIGLHSEDLLFSPFLRSCVYGEDAYREHVLVRYREFAPHLQEFLAGAPEPKSQEFVDRVGFAARALEFNIRFLASSYKPKAFEEEREWRAVFLNFESLPIKFRVGPHGLVPYLPMPVVENKHRLPISRIYIGPTQSPDHGRASTRLFLELSGFSQDAEFIVLDSGIPYRA